MNKTYPILYSRDTKGKVRMWQLIREGCQYKTVSGLMDGEKVESGWQYAEIKNSGKANATDPEEQADKECLAKIKKRLKVGYYEKIEDVDSNFYIEPMKSKSFVDYQDKIEYPVAIESKLNGICCIRDNRGATSYKGEQFYCVKHILNATEVLLKKYPKIYLHGELFSYKYKNLLNRMASLVSVNRKEKDVTPENEEEAKNIVEFFIYDGFGGDDITEETPYENRKTWLRGILKGVPYIQFVDYKLAHSLKEVNDELEETKKRKEEGLMVKLLKGKYERKRSKNSLKYKNWTDEEFQVLDVKPGTGHWHDCGKTVVCKLGNGTFDCNMRGTQEELRELLKNKQNYIGLKATVRFQEKSEYGKPLIPYSELPFRNYE